MRNTSAGCVIFGLTNFDLNSGGTHHTDFVFGHMHDSCSKFLLPATSSAHCVVPQACTCGTLQPSPCMEASLDPYWTLPGACYGSKYQTHNGIGITAQGSEASTKTSGIITKRTRNLRQSSL